MKERRKPKEREEKRREEKTGFQKLTDISLLGVVLLFCADRSDPIRSNRSNRSIDRSMALLKPSTTNMAFLAAEQLRASGSFLLIPLRCFPFPCSCMLPSILR
jgi:hypothetical protein